MNNLKIKHLLEAEDSLNADLKEEISSNYDDDSFFSGLSLAEDVQISEGEKRPKEDHTSLNDLSQEEVLSIVRESHSNLFYKISNHLNIMSLCSHFQHWKDDGQNMFSFYSFLNYEESFKTTAAIAAYFEHKFNYKILVLVEDTDIVHRYVDADSENGTVIEVSDHIHYGSVFDLITSLDVNDLAKELSYLKKEYDLILVLYPENLKEKVVNDNVKVLALNADNVNYLLSSSGTSKKQLKDIRSLFRKIGVKEGGVVLEESDHE